MVKYSTPVESISVAGIREGAGEELRTDENEVKR
jgi:hypothetical protein